MKIHWQTKLGAYLVAAAGISRLLQGDWTYTLLAGAVLIFGWKLMKAEHQLKLATDAVGAAVPLVEGLRLAHNDMVNQLTEKKSEVTFYRRQLNEAQALIGKANMILRGQQ